MPTIRIPDGSSDWAQPWMCQHPAHNPPTMMVFKPGHYVHICPGCGHRQSFYVARRSWL